MSTQFERVSPVDKRYIVAVSGTASQYGGMLEIRITSAQTVTIQISGTCGSINPSGLEAGASGYAQIGVRSIAQRQAEEAAAAQAAAQAQAAAAAAAAENARIAAEEASRQAIIDESIRAEQESIAAESASIAASESESASIEESIRKESESIEASKELESRQASLEESRSIREEELSSEAVEATRAYEIDDAFYVPYESRNWKKTHFLFAVENTLKTLPEGFTREELVINEQKVDAFRSPDMYDGMYLVYGKRGERKIPEYYYYNTNDESMISYKAIHGVEPGKLSSSEEARIRSLSGGGIYGQEPVSEGQTVPRMFLLFLLALSVLVVALLVLLILFIWKRRKEQEERAAELTAIEGLKKELEEKERKLSEIEAGRMSALRSGERKQAEKTADGVLLKNNASGSRKDKRRHGK